MGKVLFASEEVTVHTSTAPVQKDQFGNDFWDVRSVTLLPGESVPEGSVPTYVLDAVKSGKVAGLSLRDESDAAELKAKADEIRALAAGLPGGVVPATFGYTAGEDNSHSDFLVSDEDRQAGLKGVAEAEAGAGEKPVEVEEPVKETKEEKTASETKSSK